MVSPVVASKEDRDLLLKPVAVVLVPLVEISDMTLARPVVRSEVKAETALGLSVPATPRSARGVPRALCRAVDALAKHGDGRGPVLLAHAQCRLAEQAMPVCIGHGDLTLAFHGVVSHLALGRRRDSAPRRRCGTYEQNADSGGSDLQDHRHLFLVLRVDYF